MRTPGRPLPKVKKSTPSIATFRPLAASWVLISYTRRSNAVSCWLVLLEAETPGRLERWIVGVVDRKRRQYQGML
jgi:hypothetical protein